MYEFGARGAVLGPGVVGIDQQGDGRPLVSEIIAAIAATASSRLIVAPVTHLISTMPSSRRRMRNLGWVTSLASPFIRFSEIHDESFILWPVTWLAGSDGSATIANGMRHCSTYRAGADH
jgi:hypothetical protein